MNVECIRIVHSSAQIISAAQTLALHPSSKIAKENLEVFCEAWESQLCDMALLLREINDVFEGRRGQLKSLHWLSVSIQVSCGKRRVQVWVSYKGQGSRGQCAICGVLTLGGEQKKERKEKKIQFYEKPWWIIFFLKFSAVLIKLKAGSMNVSFQN